MNKGYDIYQSDLIGPIGVVVSERGLEKIILFEDKLKSYLEQNPSLVREVKLCEPVIRQLDEYFMGKRKDFDLKLYMNGTEFSQKVWEKLRHIPYGQTVSYSDLALSVEKPKAVRAVGGANRRNPVPIIIPCHRVIGKNGAMTGFAGDRIETKVKLLEHERRYLSGSHL